MKHASDRPDTLSDSSGVCGLQGDNHECLVDPDDSKPYKTEINKRNGLIFLCLQWLSVFLNIKDVERFLLKKTKQKNMIYVHVKLSKLD